MLRRNRRSWMKESLRRKRMLGGFRRMNEGRNDDIDRFEEIIDEIRELAEEAFSIVEGVARGDSVMVERARRYWYPQIIVALSNDHEFLARGSHTMSDTLKELQDIQQAEDEDEYEEREDEDEGV